MMIRYSLIIVLALSLVGVVATHNANAALFTGTGPGSSTIGSGGDYASLKAACDAVNAAGSLSGGDWTFFITGNLTETDDCFLGANTNGNTITFKPAATVTATISFVGATSGYAAGGGANWAIGLTSGNPLTYVADTDNIVIDGSNSVGGTTRDLTITGSTTTTPAAQTRRSVGVFRDCDNFTVKNVILSNNGTQVTGAAGLTPDNILFDNCEINITLIDSTYSANAATNVLYRDCIITNTSAQSRSFTLNTVNDISFLRCTFNHTSSSSNQVQGLWCGLSTPKIMNFDECNITHRNTGNGANSGGAFVTTFMADTVNMRNNFITLHGAATGSTTGTGMAIVEISDAVGPPLASVNFYHNSCIMSTTPDTGDGGSPRFAIIRCLNGSQAYTGTTNFRNNVVLNKWHTKTGVTAGALVFAGNSGTLVSDNNLIYVDTATDPNNRFGFFNAVDYADRASWNAGTGQDASSADNVNPLSNWISDTDFHFQNQPSGAPEWTGAPIGIMTDYDGDSRSATAPTKGADEGLPYNPASVGGYQIYR